LYSRSLKLRNTCAVAGVSNARCFPEKSFSRARGVFSNKTCFVFVHEAHLCHRTDFLFEALVAMLRTCVFLRHPYISAAQLQEWSMRKRVTYRASPEYGLISIFHSVKNAYFITPHSQPISRNAKCSLVVPRPLRRVGLFLRE